jgi:hypothetical protein
VEGGAKFIKRLIGDASYNILLATGQVFSHKCKLKTLNCMKAKGMDAEYFIGLGSSKSLFYEGIKTSAC